MKKIVTVVCISLFISISLTSCSRYGYTHKSFSTDEDIHSLQIDELDTTIIIEFSDEFEQLRVNYCESKEVKEVTYDISSEDAILKIKKKDVTNGFAFHLLSESDDSEEIPELRIEIPKSHMESINISATDSSVKIIGGEIDSLSIKTSYYPIEIDHTAVNSFTGVTRYSSIIAAIIGVPADFTVKSSAEEGNNNLKDHNYNGEKEINLKTEYGDINVTFTKNNEE